MSAIQTANELSQAIGNIREFHRDGLVFHVRITDARRNYGGTEYRIVPLAGSGARWVRETSLRSLHEVQQ